MKFSTGVRKASGKLSSFVADFQLLCSNFLSDIFNSIVYDVILTAHLDLRT